MNRTRSPRYPKELGRRTVLDSGDNKERAQRLSELFRLLFDHYEIDSLAPDAWLRLAWSLAEAHVPAFRFYSRSGGPFARYPAVPKTPGEKHGKGGWDLWLDLKLYVEVEKRAKGKSVARACQDLVRVPQFKNRLGLKEQPPSAETLRRRYYLLKRDPKFCALSLISGPRP